MTRGLSSHQHNAATQQTFSARPKTHDAFFTRLIIQEPYENGICGVLATCLTAYKSKSVNYKCKELKHF